MPYLSWMEGNQPFRHAVVENPCLLGRDPVACAVAQPALGTVSPIHAALSQSGGAWRVKDLESADGSNLNGLPVNPSQGHPLQDGDELVLGTWRLTFTEGFPGLDGATFVERVGDLFDEMQAHPGQTFLPELKQLYSATEKLLGEADSDALERTLLEESLRLMAGDRGFFVVRLKQGGWRTTHRVGDVGEEPGPSPAVLDYATREHTAILSNQPQVDPRFEGADRPEQTRSPLVCAPLVEEGGLVGALYLDRTAEDRPFSRLDLAMLQAYVRRGSLVLRQARLQRHALGQAEQQGELLRLRNELQRDSERRGERLAAMATSLRRIQGWAQELPEAAGAAIRFQLEHLSTLLEEGQRGAHLDAAPVAGQPLPVAALQADLTERWEALLALRHARLRLPSPPQGAIWCLGGSLQQALDGLVEPLIMQLSPGAEAFLRWGHERGLQVLRLDLPSGLRGPAPDDWTHRTLQEAGVRWRWADQALDVFLPEGPEAMPEEPARPLLGLVSEDLDLLGLFQTVAEAGDLLLDSLELVPPPPPLPKYRFLVIDAKDARDPQATIRAYRHHPSFATTPILVVRCTEDDTLQLIEAGATDWLAEGFRWEALYHRLRVLRGHTELRQRALAAERLESFRQMAGTLKHEINNPLAVISMQVEMLQRKYPEEGKLAKIGEMVDRIQTLVQVLQKIRETPTEGYADGSSILRLG
jgi:GAF domain-containing protein